MPKVFSQLLLVVIMLFCGSMLCACDEPTLKPKGMTIETLPDNFSYVVGQELSLTGGQLKVTYEDDSTRLFPMSLATPSITKFDIATNEQQVVLNFMGFTARFSVVVEKGSYYPVINSSQTNEDDGLPIIYTAYTGAPITFSGIDPMSLPDENLTIQYLYKNTSLDNAEYTQTPPTNAGTYAVKVQISGSQNYRDVLVNCYFIIQKSSLFDLTLNGENLNYDDSALNTQNGTYGASVNVSNYWRHADNSLGDAPLPVGIVGEMQYAYKRVDATDYTNIPGRTTDGAHNIMLDVGEYDIRISLAGDSNIQDYVYTFRYVITKGDLVRGQDYDLYISDGTTQTLLNANTPVPAVVFAPNTTYSLVLVARDGLNVTLKTGTIYYAGNSTAGDTILQPSTAGEYRAVYGINGNANYKDISNETICFAFE